MTNLNNYRVVQKSKLQTLSTSSPSIDRFSIFHRHKKGLGLLGKMMVKCRPTWAKPVVIERVIYTRSHAVAIGWPIVLPHSRLSNNYSDCYQIASPAVFLSFFLSPRYGQTSTSPTSGCVNTPAVVHNKKAPGAD